MHVSTNTRSASDPGMKMEFLRNFMSARVTYIPQRNNVKMSLAARSLPCLFTCRISSQDSFDLT